MGICDPYNYDVIFRPARGECGSAFPAPLSCDSALSSWHDTRWYKVLHTKVYYCDATRVRGRQKPGRTLWQPSPRSLVSADKRRKEWIQKEIAIRSWKIRKDGESECTSRNAVTPRSLRSCGFYFSFAFFSSHHGGQTYLPVTKNAHLSRPCVDSKRNRKQKADRRSWLEDMKNEQRERKNKGFFLWWKHGVSFTSAKVYERPSVLVINCFFFS